VLIALRQARKIRLGGRQGRHQPAEAVEDREPPRTPPPPPTRSLALTPVYGATEEETERLVAIARQHSEEFIDARVVLQAGRAHHFQHRIRETEEAVRLVRSYQPARVLGVLQTQAYMAAIFSPGGDLSEEDAAGS
jgi:hypothetical protein